MNYAALTFMGINYWCFLRGEGWPRWVNLVIAGVLAVYFIYEDHIMYWFGTRKK